LPETDPSATILELGISPIFGTYHSCTDYTSLGSDSSIITGHLTVLSNLEVGGGARATGQYSHALGYGTTASGDYSHASGERTTAFGYASHAEGSGTRASKDYSHAEGNTTTASGSESHAEG
jgi:hypothetical protein